MPKKVTQSFAEMSQRYTERGKRRTWQKNRFLFLSGILCLHSIIWLYRIAPQHVGGDFFIYWEAFAKLSSGGNPYELFHIGTGFLNHPFLLTLISPLKLIANAQVRLWMWWLVGGLGWVGALGLMVKLMGGQVRIFRNTQHATGQTGSLFSRNGLIPLFLLFLLFVPVTEAFYVGQVNFIVTFLICLCCFCEHQSRNLAAGVALGAAILLKTSPIMLLFYFIAVRNWQVLLAAAGMVLGGTAVAIIQFSPKWIPQFLTTLGQINGDIHAGRFNQSLLALFYRAVQAVQLPLDGSDLLHYAIIFQGGMIAFVVIYAWRRCQRPLIQRPSIGLFAIFNSLMVLFSPLVWTHHALFLLLPLVLLMVSSKKTAGMIVFSLFQLNRIFEAFIYPLALPSAIGMILLFVFLWQDWFNLESSPSSQKGNQPACRQQNAASNGQEAAVS